MQGQPNRESSRRKEEELCLSLLENSRVLRCHLQGAKGLKRCVGVCGQAGEAGASAGPGSGRTLLQTRGGLSRGGPRLRAEQSPGGSVSGALHGESGVLSPSPSPCHGTLDGPPPPRALLSSSGNEGVGPPAPEALWSCHTLWFCLLGHVGA